MSVALFQREESFIEGTTLPFFVYVMRLALQSVIRAGYVIAGCVVILVFGGSPVAIPWLWSLAGLLLILFATPALIISFLTASSLLAICFGSACSKRVHKKK